MWILNQSKDELIPISAQHERSIKIGEVNDECARYKIEYWGDILGFYSTFKHAQLVLGEITDALLNKYTVYEMPSRKEIEQLFEFAGETK